MTSSSAQEGNRPPGSFVGRERDLAELRAGLTDATAGHGDLFLLSGEPGIGKTRLADEFGRLTVAQGVRAAWGRCWQGDRALAYWPCIQVVRACLGDTDAEQRAAILSSETPPQVAQDIALAEPWDCGPGGYQVGSFPPGWAEWNDTAKITSEYSSFTTGGRTPCGSLEVSSKIFLRPW
jgi:hypothetical protein